FVFFLVRGRLLAVALQVLGRYLPRGQQRRQLQPEQPMLPAFEAVQRLGYRVEGPFQHRPLARARRDAGDVLPALGEGGHPRSAVVHDQRQADRGGAEQGDEIGTRGRDGRRGAVVRRKRVTAAAPGVGGARRVGAVGVVVIEDDALGGETVQGGR